MPGTYTVTEQSIDHYLPCRIATESHDCQWADFYRDYNNKLKRTAGDYQIFEDNFVEGVTSFAWYIPWWGLPVDEYAITNASGVAKFENVLINGNEPYTSSKRSSIQ